MADIADDLLKEKNPPPLDDDDIALLKTYVCLHFTLPLWFLPVSRICVSPGLGVDARALENRLKFPIARVHVPTLSFLRGGIEVSFSDRSSVSGFGAWLLRMEIWCDDEFCNPW